MSVARKIRTLFFIAKHKPSRAWEELQIRAERKTGVSLFFLSARRLMTYAFEAFRTQPVTSELRRYGNYYLDPSLIPERPIVFSLGVGQDISFDRSLLDRHDVQLFLFDPTPASRRFVEGLKLPPGARFFPVAVTDHDGQVALFTDDLQEDFERTASVSIFKRGFFESAASVECKKVKTLMTEQGVSRLDILKMDIEGAAIQVLEDLLRDGIYPTQLACEFERPERLTDVYPYLKKLSALFDQLEGLGYRLYRTRPLDKGCQVEILAVRSRQTESKANPS